MAVLKMILTIVFILVSIVLTVVVLMFLFCEVEDKVKGVAVKVIAFFAGLTLVSVGWGLIVDAVRYICTDSVELFNMLNYTIGTSIDLTNIVNPVSVVLNILDDVVTLFIGFAKFFFILNVLRNKPMKENIIVKKINEYVANVVNYMNSVDMVMPAAPAAPVAPEAPVQQ